MRPSPTPADGRRRSTSAERRAGVEPQAKQASRLVDVADAGRDPLVEQRLAERRCRARPGRRPARRRRRARRPGASRPGTGRGRACARASGSPTAAVVGLHDRRLEAHGHPAAVGTDHGPGQVGAAFCHRSPLPVHVPRARHAQVGAQGEPVRRSGRAGACPAPRRPRSRARARGRSPTQAGRLEAGEHVARPAPGAAGRPSCGGCRLRARLSLPAPSPERAARPPRPGAGTTRSRSSWPCTIVVTMSSSAPVRSTSACSSLDHLARVPHDARGDHDLIASCSAGVESKSSAASGVGYGAGRPWRRRRNDRGSAGLATSGPLVVVGAE